MKLLLVDDSNDVLELLSELAQTIEGLEIVGRAQREDEAIELFLKQKPDVVFIDIRLKQGRGIDVLKRIKKETPSVIVFILTSYLYPQYWRKCHELGANYYFDKLFELSKAIEKLRNLNQQTKKEEKKQNNG